jgi:hypothetical protein
MKGPYERLKYDPRRLWECPQCKRRERTGGGVTFRFCACTAKDGEQPTVMHLVADGPQRLVPVIARPRPERVEELPAEVPASEFLAAHSADIPAAEIPSAETPNDSVAPDSAGDDATDVE